MEDGFSTELYVAAMTASIKERCAMASCLYLEVGGHLFFDQHASRTLPGFNPMCKLLMLKSFPLKKTSIVCSFAKLVEEDEITPNSSLRYTAACEDVVMPCFVLVYCFGWFFELCR
jgi:uncharacterized protein (UPF0371 family)